MDPMEKIHLFLLLTAVFAVSCNHDQFCSDPSDLSHSASVITIDEALSVLNEALATINPVTKSGDAPQIDEILTISQQDIRQNGNSTELVYVVNFAEDEGFALLSADSRLPDQIIAIVENGSMDSHLKIQNRNRLETKGALFSDSSTLFLENLLRRYLINGDGGEDDNDDDDDGDYSSPDINEKIDTGSGSGSSSQSPILRLLWDQIEPFNNLSPMKSGVRCYAGCVPVALGMILTHNRFPTTYTIGGHVLNWDEMGEMHTYYDRWNEVGKDDVAMLLSDIGKWCNAVYTKDWTFATPASAKNYMESVGYSNATLHSSYDENEVLPMLWDGKPVFIAALPDLISLFFDKHDAGHAWVIDGYFKMPEILLMHCNWGWGGICNGYYASRVFDTKKGAVITDSKYGDSDAKGGIDMDWWFRVITY